MKTDDLIQNLSTELTPAPRGWVARRLAIGLGGGAVPLPNPQDSLYWGGYGGSLVIIDMKARTTFGYAMNKMAGTTTGDMRALGLAMAMWGALGLI